MVARVGVIGAGQLGKMLAEAMINMEVDFTLYDSQPDACGHTLGPMIHADFDNTEALDMLVSRSDIVTCEFENVPVASLEYIERITKMAPPARAFAFASNRVREKELFRQLAIECAQSRVVNSLEDLRTAADDLGFPFLLKTCSGGYDGKGQVVIHQYEELIPCYGDFAHLPCIAEQQIDFVEEVSCIVVRNSIGETRSYPLSKNIHKDGILRVSYGCNNHPLEHTAVAYTCRLAEYLNYTGIMTVEYFVTADGHLLANEMAPRVHNSGHWTIEGAITSQFENHIRALLDMPLGDTAMIQHAAMVNLLGCMPEVPSDQSTFVHVYGKRIQPNRKVGHVTLIENKQTTLEQRVRALHRQIYSFDLPDARCSN